MIWERSPLFYPFFPRKWKEVGKKDFTYVSLLSTYIISTYIYIIIYIYIYIINNYYFFPFFQTPLDFFLFFGFLNFQIYFSLFFSLEFMEKRKEVCKYLKSNELRPNLFSIFFPLVWKEGGV